MAQFARPTSDQAAGSWSSTPLWSKVDDAVSAADGTTISSDDNTSPDNADLQLGSVTDPSASTGHVIRALWNKSGSGGHSVNAVCELWEGVPGTGTLRATLSVTGIGNTPTTDSYTLSGAEADSITDYSNLFFRVSRQGDTGGNPSTRRALVVDAVEFEVPDVSQDRIARVSAAELEVENAPRTGRVSAAELETPDAPRRARVSAGELEAPTAPRRARVAAVETEVPTAPRTGRVSAGEMEAPDAPRAARVSAGELETPDVSQDRAVRVSAAELGAPTAPRTGRVSAAELDVPENTNRAARVSASEMEAVDAPRRARLSAGEIQVQSVGEGSLSSSASFPPASSSGYAVPWRITKAHPAEDM